MIVIIVPVLALLAGCGSSKHAASSTATSKPSAPATTTSPSTPSSSSTTSTSGTTTQPGTKTTGTSNPTGGAGLPSGSGGSGSGGSGSGGSTNARVPATFTIASGGQLSPPTISAPAFLAIQLTVVSHDGKAHQLRLRTPSAHSLAVPAHGRASVLIPGLRVGHYPLEIDGAARAALSIGGEPGP